MTMTTSIKLVLALLMVIYVGSLATAAEPQLTDDQAKGRALFNENCSLCHGERGHATTLLGKRLGPENAVLERRTNLNADLIRHVVRHGLNSMPWFRRAELPDRELESIVSYLTRSS
jgi:mono/diheme cytochrome c family protein